MTSDSLRNPFSMMKKRGRASRQMSSTDGLQSPGKLADSFNPLPRSSTGLITSTIAGELKSDPGAGNGQTLSVRDLPARTQPRSINVVLFGETGVGKSSVINLIARKEIAQVSSDVNGCTMQYKCYDISFDNMDFAIFDTIGLEEPQMGVNGYLKAIEKAYELISRLGAAGGIHLLLFCMRGGRITATTQSNYRLFCECLCNTKVPIALVFTGLEREVQMEDWWMRNKKHIEDYGIKSDGHACITAVQDDAPGEDQKYMESQEIIRKLLKDCARKNEAFAPESHSWLARITRGMRGFIAGKKSPKKKDVLKVLTHRCKLDAETAKKIADLMEKGDTEHSDSKDPQAGNGEGEDGKENDLAKNSVNDDASPTDHDDIEAAPNVVQNKEREFKATSEDAPPSDVTTAPEGIRNRETGVGNAAGDIPPRKSDNVTAGPDVVRNAEREVKNVTGDTLPNATINVTPPDVGRKEEGGVKNVARDSPPGEHSKVNDALDVGQKEEGGVKNIARDPPPSERSKVNDVLDVGRKGEGGVKNIAINFPPSEHGKASDTPEVMQNRAREVRHAADGIPPGGPIKDRATHDARNREGVVRKTAKGAPSNDATKAKPAPDVVRNKERVVESAIEDVPLSEPIRLRPAPDSDTVRIKEREVRNATRGIPPSEPVQGKTAPSVRKMGIDTRRLAEKGGDGLREAEWARYSPKMPGDFTAAVRP